MVTKGHIAFKQRISDMDTGIVPKISIFYLESYIYVCNLYVIF